MRIVSLLASATEILYGLGLGEELLAVSHECDYPADALNKPRVTQTAVNPQAESSQIDRQVCEMIKAGNAIYTIDEPHVAALQPKLIITQAQCEVCAVNYEDVARFARQKLPEAQVLALNPCRLTDLWADVGRVGLATDRQTQAARLVESLQQRVEAVRCRTAEIPPHERPLVACIEWIEPMYLAANWMPELIELAGGRQPFTQAGAKSVATFWDRLVEVDPDVIVVMPCGFDLARSLAECPLLAARPSWQQLKAVRTDRVYAVDGSAYFNRSGPRLVDSLEILARLLHPGRFGLDEQATSEAEMWKKCSVAKDD